jgi:MoxR-like ATPase
MTMTETTRRVEPGEAITIDRAGEIVTGLEREIAKVIVGQHVLVRRMLTALFAAIPFSASRGGARAGCGHLLLEGVPGVAKTLTATTLAQAISAKFQRVQLTPDLLPADILGTRIYDAKSSSFRIEQGPVFTNILLADEINRATPKTQSRSGSSRLRTRLSRKVSIRCPRRSWIAFR